jgi:threonine synthase
MKWTNGIHTSTSKNAILNSISDGNLLWMPDHIPIFDSEFIKNLDIYSPHHICTEILKTFFYPDLDLSTLSKIVKHAMIFDTPLHKLKEDDYILELFHGPTMAFKDVGARVMAQIYKYMFPTTTPCRVVVAT